MEKQKPINLFWKGGWDSTFRLLQLTVIYKKLVQPHYLLDPVRKSIHYELNAMEKILQIVAKKYPESRKLIHPVKMEFVPNLTENRKVTEAYNEVIKKDKIGIQYEILSRYCYQYEISDMEICNETSIHPKENIVKRVFGPVTRINDDADYHYILDEKFENYANYYLFKNFKLALFRYTKLEMAEMAKKEGFFEMMEQTWFCHLPRKNGNPCGKCHPCKAVFTEDLKWRLPMQARIRYFTRPALRKMAKYSGIARLINHE